MPTIGDVAARAGVGVATVSRVLNGHPRVSEPTRARVLAAIAELGYEPNPLARGLSLGSSTVPPAVRASPRPGSSPPATQQPRPRRKRG